jgi:hypothetical protein
VSSISDVKRFTRLALGLREYLKTQITLKQCEEIIRSRILNRENNFLHLIKKTVYDQPNSPYSKLLNVAGCEFEDIKKLVEKNGIEYSLQQLYNAGVYLSFEEFKGTKETIRGGKHFLFKEADFNNPLLSITYQVETSGSRGNGTKAIFDFSHRLDASFYTMLSLATVDALDIPMALWMPVPPSIAGIGNLLDQYKIGHPVEKWFSPVDQTEVQTPLKHRLALKYIVYWGRLWGAHLTYPERVSLTNALKIARWLEKTKYLNGNSALNCSSVGMAVKVCDEASENNLDIKGVKLFVSGEPLTKAKRDRIESTGALVIPRYSNTEIGRMGLGCLDSKAIDGVHLLHDRVALIQRNRMVDNTDIQIESFLFTSLLESSPKCLFNVEMDDFGALEKHECPCLLGKLGYNWHIHNIRSFSKLTGNGMTIIGSDLITTIEKTLPDKFGGSPIDYQIIEEEDEKGTTSLIMVISPAVGTINEDEVKNVILNDLRKNAVGGKLAAGLWNQINTLKMKRMNPISKSGKILTLFLSKKTDNDSSSLKLS